LTPLRYKLRAVSISSTAFLLIEGMQCSLSFTLVLTPQLIGAAPEGVIGNP
jgi:hypothetical protein